MIKAEIIFTHLRELCLFRRASETRDCQIDFDRKVLRGYFPEMEISVAVSVYGAIVNEPMTE